MKTARSLWPRASGLWFSLITLCLSALLGCEAEPLLAPPQQGGAQAPPEAGETAGAESGRAGAQGSAEPYFEGARYMREGTHVNIVHQLRFIELEGDGVARGFDLDGRRSEDGDEESCGHGDFTSPEGREGVDNQLAELWATIAPLVGEQAHALLQNAVNEGRVLVMLELEGVDDLWDDEDVTLNIFKGSLRPHIGTQGVITPDQTFDFDYESPISSATGLKIVGGQLIAGPLEINIPVTILSLDVVVKVELARVQLTLNQEGEMSGYLTGALHVPTLTEALINTDAEREARLVAPFFERNADMVKVDGVCTYLSMGLSFEATRAFVVRDLTRER